VSVIKSDFGSFELILDCPRRLVDTIHRWSVLWLNSLPIWHFWALSLSYDNKKLGRLRRAGNQMTTMAKF